MKSYKIAVTAFLLISCLSLAVSPAFAQDSTSSASTSIHERRIRVEQHIKDLKMNASSSREKLMKEKELRGMGSSTREEKIELRCGQLTERIEKRLSNFGTLFQSHVQNHRAHLEKLKLISSKSGAKGLDVTKLNSDIAILEAKVNKLVADKESVKTSLSLTRDYSCGDMSGDFKTAVETVRDAQKIVAEDARDIFEFVKTTIRADIEALRKEYNKEKESESSAN